MRKYKKIIKHLGNSEKPSRPNLLICGAARSGTTSLIYYLNEHPKIQFLRNSDFNVIGGVEIGFPFNCLGAAMAHARDECGEYEKVCRRITANVRYIGWRVVYSLIYPHVIMNIAEHLPNTRILISLRDPVETCFSFYSRARADGSWEGSFEEFLRLGELSEQNISRFDARKGWPKILTERNERSVVLERGCYFYQLKRLFRFFSREQVFIINFHRMIRQPEETMQDILAFLDLDCGFHFTRLGEVKSASEKHDHISQETYKRLRDHFSQSDERVFEMLGWPMNAWDYTQ